MSRVIPALALLVLASLSFRALAGSGMASFRYPPYVPSACNGFQDDGVMIAAVSEPLWDDGRVCRAMYHVKCIGPHMCRGNGTVTVMIVDHCPPSACNGTLVLSQDAFANIADPEAGKIEISFLPA